MIFASFIRLKLRDSIYKKSRTLGTENEEIHSLYDAAGIIVGTVLTPLLWSDTHCVFHPFFHMKFQNWESMPIETH